MTVFTVRSFMSLSWTHYHHFTSCCPTGTDCRVFSWPWQWLALGKTDRTWLV